jgi:hypothetical protein
MNAHSPLEQSLSSFLKTDQFSLKKLHGEASNRIYYRLSLPDRSYIVMQLPPDKWSVSEEITNLKEKPTELPFVSIDRFLRSEGLPVPEILHEDKKAGFLLLEDFGDETFEKRIIGVSSEIRRDWYKRAIALLVKFQKVKNGSIAHQRSFDETLLNWEFQHFIEYGIEARLGLSVEEKDLQTIRQGMNFITFALTKLPQTLVHRDFQSRNLMVVADGSLKLLDFQDALMGPLPYDLVALLRDSYVALPTNDLSLLIDDYLQIHFAETGEKLERRFFHKMFDWMTIQRKLKDAGRFVYIDKVKGNPSFLPSIPNSLSYVREAFERQEELKSLYETLKKYVPEFQ